MHYSSVQGGVGECSEVQYFEVQCSIMQFIEGKCSAGAYGKVQIRTVLLE